tara:strand:- start:407 stop:610 length:204 start_codon:yes stop_codon:yes gene_type:complete
MKAIIQLEIPDNKLSDDETKEELVEKLANIFDKWLKGEGTINIDFIQTYENDEQMYYPGWTTDTTIN